MRKLVQVLRYEGISGLQKKCAAVLNKQHIFEHGNDYEKWVRLYDSLDNQKISQICDGIQALTSHPLISVVMPVYDSPIEFLDLAIWSVRNQLYPHWELCIADDASSNQAVRDLIAQHANEDSRIKSVYRKENGHISRASNSALELATGVFIALLDHDDELPVHALYWIAYAINQNPGVGIIYSDEDKIDESGRRFDPYFKCAFNYELLLAQNMISHLGVYRRSLLTKIGGFRVGFEGSQDYDLCLRVLEQIDHSQILHIPKVLYHWRAIKGSAALARNQKTYAVEAGRRAVDEHLMRLNVAATVLLAPEVPCFNRVKFLLPNPAPLVSIIIPTKDCAHLLRKCINSILEKTSYPSYEIIILDNGSVEPATHQLFKALPQEQVQIIRDDSPFNFSKLNNQGVKFSRGDLICLMNNDIEILTPDWLEEMASFASRPEIGCVGSRLWYPDFHLQHGGVILGIGGIANHAHYRMPRNQHGYFGRAQLHQSFSAVTAACLLVRRSVFEQVGGLDEELAVAFNDVDFCLRVREAGYRNVWTPYAEMIHHESASRGYENTPEKQTRFSKEVTLMKERWGDRLLQDPAYSPNLTLECENFSYAFPPRVNPEFLTSPDSGL
jgi:GT2 family glycosyltransferase